MKMVEIGRPGHFMRADLQRKYQRFFPTWENLKSLVEAERKAKSEIYKTSKRKYKKVKTDAV
jgi:hypothetical protein